MISFPDPSFFLFIAASVADAAAVKPSIPNLFATDFNKGNPDFNNDIQIFKNPPFCILVNCAFDNLISTDAWLANVFLRLKICLLVNNNL